jgi:hypothetical protein
MPQPTTLQRVNRVLDIPSMVEANTKGPKRVNLLKTQQNSLAKKDLETSLWDRISSVFHCCIR